MKKKKAGAPPTRSFSDASSALASAKRLHANGQISKAELDAIKEMAAPVKDKK